MLRENFDHGFSVILWESAKIEAKNILIERAKVRGQITYSELVSKINIIKLAAHDPRLFHFLGEIASEEDAAGRGMLTVIVVHKQGDMEPGNGFFELAKKLGRETSDPIACWVNEMHKVHKYWSINNL